MEKMVDNMEIARCVVKMHEQGTDTIVVPTAPLPEETVYFLLMEVNERVFVIESRPRQQDDHIEKNHRTPFSSEDEKEIFVNFAKVFSEHVNQAIPLESQ